MPLYTYTCRIHGEFEAWAKMAESDAPMPCPSCAEAAPRALARPMIAKGGGDADLGSDMAGGDMAGCDMAGSEMGGCGLEGCGMGACGMEAGGEGMGGGHVCGAGCMH